jgi:DNA modification methylase
MGEIGHEQVRTDFDRGEFRHIEKARDALAVARTVHPDVEFGLPEWNDRYAEWRVPLMAGGEVCVLPDGTVNEARSTKPAPPAPECVVADWQDQFLVGDSEHVLSQVPDAQADLIFTSPPYYNARPQYAEYPSYEGYLDAMQRVFAQAVRVLAPGRFCVVNTSPVLIPRRKRSEASKRLAVPYDLHARLTALGLEFVDDIFWVKPEGAGWACGRGRRFAADRQPMQYKPVPVTEHVMVYRKPGPLIDWFVRRHPGERIEEYETTNLWRVCPSPNKHHPATFPVGLAERVVTYYSFRGDLVLDPFAGVGTVGRAAKSLGRRYFLIDREEQYRNVFVQGAKGG